MGNPYSYRESDVSLHDARIREAHNHRHFAWAEGDATGYARAKAESDKAKAEQAEIVSELVEAAENFAKELGNGVLEELRYTWGETNFQIVKATRWLLLQAIAKAKKE